MGVKRLHITVKGQVQGVFFRAHTQKTAETLGLTGWVRNTPDGGVEIVAEGDADKISTLVNWCHKGPSMAAVSRVDTKEEKATGEFDSFNIKYF